MKRTKLADREMPDYSQGEELSNVVTHIAGAVLGLVALIWCLILATTAIEIVTSIVFSISMILLYTISGIYHGLTDSYAKRVFQVLDHCTIYLFIAATYTIVMLVSVRPENAAIAWVVFAIEWVMAAIAMTLTAIDLKRYQYFSMVCYLVLGWAGVIAVVHRRLGPLRDRQEETVLPFGLSCIHSAGQSAASLRDSILRAVAWPTPCDYNPDSLSKCCNCHSRSLSVAILASAGSTASRTAVAA
jgi:hemolysin III